MGQIFEQMTVGSDVPSGQVNLFDECGTYRMCSEQIHSLLVPRVIGRIQVDCPYAG